MSFLNPFISTLRTFNLELSVSEYGTGLRLNPLTSPRRPTWQEERRNPLLYHQKFRKLFPPYGRTNIWCCSKQITRSWSRLSFGSWRLGLTYGWSRKLHVSAVESITDMILGEVNNSLKEQHTKESPYCLISVCSNGIPLQAVNAVVYSFLYFIHIQLLHLPSKIIVWLSLYLIRRDSLKGTRAQSHCSCLSVTRTPYSQNDNMTLHCSMQRDANYKCHRDCSV